MSRTSTADAGGAFTALALAAVATGGAFSTISRSMILPEKAADEEENAGAGMDVTGILELAVVGGGNF